MSGAGEAPRVLAIVGATASGKTDLGEALAHAIGGEVVCADSRQVYRELEIGTGKPDAATRARQPHHLFDALELGSPATAGWFAGASRSACAAIHQRGRVPVLVGGSGLYLAAARQGLAPTPPVDPEVRRRLATLHAELGTPALHERLARVDPETAARLAPQDAQRVLRALEVAEGTGHPLSWWHWQPAAPAVSGRWGVVELTVAPGPLAARIEQRTRWMFEHGLIEETRDIADRGLGEALDVLRAVGYDEARAVLAGTLSKDQAIERTNLRTRQLAKRQRTWFRHQLEGERLEAGGASPEQLLTRVRRALGV